MGSNRFHFLKVHPGGKIVEIKDYQIKTSGRILHVYNDVKHHLGLLLVTERTANMPLYHKSGDNEFRIITIHSQTSSPYKNKDQLLQLPKSKSSPMPNEQVVYELLMLKQNRFIPLMTSD